MANQGVNLTAGKRVSGGERLPLGRPGERPQGFGMLAGLPRCARSVRKAAAHTCRGASLRGQGWLPGQADIGDGVARQAQLDIGEEQQPGPAVSGGAVSAVWAWSIERLFEKAEGVLDREAGDVRLPDRRQIGRSGPRPPEPQRLSALWWGEAGGRLRGESGSHAPAVVVGGSRAWHGFVAPHAGPLHARRQTDPYCGIGRRPGVRRRRPGRGIIADKLRAMSPRSPCRRLGSGVGVEATACAQAHEQTDGQSAKARLSWTAHSPHQSVKIGLRSGGSAPAPATSGFAQPPPD